MGQFLIKWAGQRQITAVPIINSIQKRHKGLLFGETANKGVNKTPGAISLCLVSVVNCI